jgi:group I intron endonuclease
MEKEIICGIYKITSPTGRIYIGQSEGIFTRWVAYKQMNVSVRRQTKLWRSFKKHLVTNHTFEIIEECLVEDLNCRERYYQDFYNVLKGGLNCILTECGAERRVISEETKQKMSNSMKGKYEGVNNPNYNNIWSEEQRLNLSVLRKDKYLGEENAMFGKNHSTLSKNKMSENRTRLFGLDNPKSKLILDLETGVFYYSVSEAAKVYGISRAYLSSMLTEGTKDKNKTTLIIC